MAIAGKVAITLSTENGGAWSADVTYDRLVAVKHNNNLYISRKTVANVEPPNNEFWFLALEGFSGDDIEDIINGTTQVGNAKTLDGHEAEDFLQTDGGGTVKSSGLAPIRMESTNAEEKTLLNFLHDGVNYGYLGFDGTNNPVFVNNYGGTGAANVMNLIHTGNMADYVLPKSGGVITAKSYIPLVLMSTDYVNALLQFIGKDGTLGYIGFDGADELKFLNSSGGASYNLLHTGNKPTGSYTGNGDATERRIETRGTGSVCMIWKNGASCIATAGGAFGMVVNEFRTSYHASFINGTIIMQTTDDMLNASGETYYYQVL